MPVFGTGNAAVGAPFAETEFEDWTGTITIATGTISALGQGQVVYRDVTQISGAPGQVGTSSQATLSDIVTNGVNNVGTNSPVYGVYQGPSISTAGTYTLLFRRRGYGLTAVTTKPLGVTVAVGASLIIGEPSVDNLAVVCNTQLYLSTVLNSYIGVACATALGTAATSYGALLMSVPPVSNYTQLVNTHYKIT